jgi:hypothetical protein
VTAVFLAAATTTIVPTASSGNSNSSLVDATFALVVVTAIAAIATAVMAWKTREAARATQASATATTNAATATARAADAAEKDVEISNQLVVYAQQQAKAAVDALTARTAPLLTFDPSESTRNDQGTLGGLNIQVGHMGAPSTWIGKQDEAAVVAAVRIRNIGPGPAHIGPADSDVELSFLSGARWAGRALARVIAQNESTIVYFAESLGMKSELLGLLMSPHAQEIDVSVRYADVARTRWLTSVLRLHLEGADLVQVETGQRRLLSFVELKIVDDKVASAAGENQQLAP